MKAEDALQKVNDALFPKPRKNKDGMMVDSDAYYNLEGALIDLRRQGADKGCIRTIERVQQQLVAVSKVLQKSGVR